MKVEFEVFTGEVICVWLSGKNSYWLTLRPQIGGATVVSWFNKNMPHVEDYFANINNPTPEEITMFCFRIWR